MRKALVIAVVTIGSAITGSAQTSQGASPQLSVTAAHVQRADAQTYFSGKVEIVFPGAKVQADNATFHFDTNTVDLYGHVQLTLPK